MSFDVRLYFSGSVDHVVTEHLLHHNVHRLFTYAYPKEVFEYLDAARDMGVTGCRIMLDSGAFTSWSIGKPVQLQELIDHNQKVIDLYGDKHEFVMIALDVIPGERGRKPTQEELVNAERESMYNFQVMQQHFAGRHVMPVYHSGEDVALRNWYLERANYMCLSMDQAMGEQDRLNFAKRAFVEGFYFHGLAATGNRMVTEVGWFSVDSSSWVTVASMGNILWPTSDGRFRTLAMSPSSPSRFDAGQHVDNLSPVEREAVDRKIAAAGYKTEELQTDYRMRWRWNIDQWCSPPWVTRINKPVDLFS